MGGLTARATYTAYRDAVGMVMAARRGDQDAVEWLLVLQPSLKSPVVDVFVAMVCGLMREVDRMGGDSEEIVGKWAHNLARKEAQT